MHREFSWRPCLLPNCGNTSVEGSSNIIHGTGTSAENRRAICRMQMGFEANRNPNGEPAVVARLSRLNSQGGGWNEPEQLHRIRIRDLSARNLRCCRQYSHSTIICSNTHGAVQRAM